MLELQRLASLVQAHEQVIDYAVRIARATRDWPGLSSGAGPRGTMALVRAARAGALMDGRDFITPDDVARQTLPALRHRVMISPDAQLEGLGVDDLLRSAQGSVQAPRPLRAAPHALAGDSHGRHGPGYWPAWPWPLPWPCSPACRWARWPCWPAPCCCRRWPAALFDLWRSRRLWRQAPLRMERTLPGAFSLGVPTVLTLVLVNEGPRAWAVTVFDEVDPRFAFEGLPQSLAYPPSLPRGAALHGDRARARAWPCSGITQLRWRSRGGCFEVQQPLGQPGKLRVYPNFAALARYAWLSGDRRLAQIGIKTYVQRGLGTDFRQLADYKTGDSLRHIDWKATLRHQRPIVREFQDDRDQCVFFLLDCGRRMRADEGGPEQDGQGSSHFDEALNAADAAELCRPQGRRRGRRHDLRLAVPGQRRDFAAAQGRGHAQRLDEPPARHPARRHAFGLPAGRAGPAARAAPPRVGDSAHQLSRRRFGPNCAPRSSCCAASTWCWWPACASACLGRIAGQALSTPADAVDVGGRPPVRAVAARRLRACGRPGPASMDVEPAQLAVSLVNRYHAVKRAGML